MIRRTALEFLSQWKESDWRKPLVIRGARQVGKTTLIQEFSKQYDVFIDLNLENESDRDLFDQYRDVHELIPAMFLRKIKKLNGGTTLIFIDEIQFSKPAIAILRYFYEEANNFHVIVAGSLLETIIDVRKISFPVGRVQYMALRPCSFLEFLYAMDNTFDYDFVFNANVEPVIHKRVMKYFRDYTLVGGMPAAIARYAENKDILDVGEVYDSLLNSYKDDIEKYTNQTNIVKVIREILETGWAQAGSLVTFEKFGGTNFSSKEMSLGFQTIQKAMLMELVYPSSSTQMPVLQNYRQRPKLMWLDTGLVNYVAGIQKEVFSTTDIQDVWRGRIAEHIVAQELLTLDNSLLTRRIYWKRDKHGSEAEVDFVYKFESLAIPVEVKSGHNSKLKSLHLFMDAAPHHIAVRVWSNNYSVDEVTTPNGKKFKLINLPFYYVGVLNKVLAKFIS